MQLCILGHCLVVPGDAARERVGLVQVRRPIISNYFWFQILGECILSGRAVWCIGTNLLNLLRVQMSFAVLLIFPVKMHFASALIIIPTIFQMRRS